MQCINYRDVPGKLPVEKHRAVKYVIHGGNTRVYGNGEKMGVSFASARDIP